MKKLTTDYFIRKSKLKYGGKYDKNLAIILVVNMDVLNVELIEKDIIK